MADFVDVRHVKQYMPRLPTLDRDFKMLFRFEEQNVSVKNFPTTNREIVEAKQLWQRKYKFPTAIGVIDCTHVGILKPKLHGDEYINRKGKSTLNVQATCDAKEMFTSVDISWPGSVHDSRIWRNSQVCLQLRTKANAVLLGDDGYGIETCLMTPYRNPTSPAEHKLNFQHVTKRSRNTSQPLTSAWRISSQLPVNISADHTH
ncbi:putative nuclease HARBI1 [Penaeus chinensis]|uniref:putative nuclease HARBI1 n=1 Tax=Penaeus chinensis TaxID=139456 RepID=UPI001FB6A0A1|nr:putative nuclease HARBI1 [Penaeus chinensis]